MTMLFLLPFLVMLLSMIVMVTDAGSYYEPAFFEKRPGVLFYMFQEEALWEAEVFSCEHHAVADCVTPPVAMEISFPALDGAPGCLGYHLPQALVPEERRFVPGRVVIPADCIGVSFCIKGDGSANRVRLEVRREDAPDGPAFEFDLPGDKWQNVLVRWDDFDGEVDSASADCLTFGLAEGAERPTHYTIDAIRFVKTDEKDVELAALIEEANARTGEAPIPARTGPGCYTFNKSGLRKARAGLRDGVAQRWLAYGDSVTVPVQQWNIPKRLHRNFAYYNVAARDVEREFGVDIDMRVNAVGGRDLHENFESLIRDLDEIRPDVAMLLVEDTIPYLRRLLPHLVAKAGEVECEVLVIVPTFEGNSYTYPYIDWMRRWAIENNIACADARRYLLLPDSFYWGDTIANPQHPNALGHRLIGEVVAEMFR